ncbi:FAD-dependent oxidoreductase [Porphyromonas pogonae]|uniref:FAD-dependent oxidoreductase n=1 Tax=Porphyromonas pogonae TaxID=867595 RepID=UPI002E7957ED|nr:FAD-dependent oxidoreductase [Porphyromonas pogonae]
MKYVIIGGVAGGATAAARLRRLDEKAEIVMLEKGPDISYANCGLPYHIGGVIREREKLMLQTPLSFKKRLNVDVMVRTEVTAINRDRKSVTVKSGKEVFEIDYDKLLISTGATPIVPPLPGIESKRIFTLRTPGDMDAIKAFASTRKGGSVAVIGAGFIGLEMAENMHEAGLAVSLVEMADQVMPPIDFSMASILAHHMHDKGVSLYLSEQVTAFNESSGGVQVQLASGKALMVDMVILSIGVKPLSYLAQQCGLELGSRQGIRVDKYLCTSDPDIYAVGDVIEYPHPILGEPWHNYLAGPANRQARIVADNMVLGNHLAYEGSIGTGIAKVFDLTVATTGVSAKRLQQLNIPYQSSITHSSSHAGYYPGATLMSVKIVFSPENGQLYGSQIVGYDGVDKRLDQIALIIKQKGTIYDLITLEQAYAPPYGSAKDPIAIAGYVADNLLSGRVRNCNWRYVCNIDPSKKILLDVRTVEEAALGDIPGSINIPVDSLREEIDKVPRDKEVIIYCAIGHRAYVAYRILEAHGYDKISILSGGYKIYWPAATPILPLERNRQKKVDTHESEPLNQDVSEVIDACGLQCPGPIMTLKKSIDSHKHGDVIEMHVSDPGFRKDVGAWCKLTGNELLEMNQSGGTIVAKIRKQIRCVDDADMMLQGRGKTFIMFSDDLDKALATFVLANGAASTGERVTIFFTFWGLNVIKKQHAPTVKKGLMDKMFGFMMPKSSLALKLSKMNMLGMGTKMMRNVMQRKHIDSLESLIMQAKASGVEFIACQMSMDVMGVKEVELMDGVEVAGVATYMQRADQSNLNLFI